MNETKVISIFQGDVADGTLHVFSFTPQKHLKHVTGLLVSQDVQLSIAFDNGTNLVVNHSEHGTYNLFAPDKRIYPLKIPLNGLPIRGSVSMGINTLFVRRTAGYQHFARVFLIVH